MSQVLRQLSGLFPAHKFPQLLVGLESADDAAVYRLNADTALIQTVDFFTPVVDDPYDYGSIAAANALSDVYAMGGKPILALNICAFPRDLPQNIVARILEGGADKVAESGAVLAGGHTIDDDEPKYGLCVTGTVHPDKLFTKTGARPGDRLVLTKPLGTGIITTALKRGAALPEHVRGAVESMKRLNSGSCGLFSRLGLKSCTDITGYGILGHAYEMAEKSGVSLEIDSRALPFLEGAARYAERSLFPGGSCRNLDYYRQYVGFEGDGDEDFRLLLATPETSGGLLGAVPAESLSACERLFAEAGQFCRIIGRVTERREKPLLVLR